MTENTFSLSIVIPARNEEHFLPTCLNSIRKAQNRIPEVNVEILVAANRCTDKTENIAQRMGCRVVHEDAKCLSTIRNKAIQEATGLGIITIDADWTISEGLLMRVCSLLKNNCLGGGCLVLLDRYSLPLLLTGAIVQAVLVRHRVALGAMFFMRSTWKEIGGFDESLLSGEDIDFAIRLRAYCRKVGTQYERIWKEHCIFSTRKFSRLGDWHYIRNLRTTLSLLRSQDRELADRYWYEWLR